MSSHSWNRLYSFKHCDVLLFFVGLLFNVLYVFCILYFVLYFMYFIFVIVVHILCLQILDRTRNVSRQERRHHLGRGDLRLNINFVGLENIEILLWRLYEKNAYLVILLQVPPLPVLQFIHQSILWARLCSKTSFPRNSISVVWSQYPGRGDDGSKTENTLKHFVFGIWYWCWKVGLHAPSSLSTSSLASLASCLASTLTEVFPPWVRNVRKTKICTELHLISLEKYSSLLLKIQFLVLEKYTQNINLQHPLTSKCIKFWPWPNYHFSRISCKKGVSLFLPTIVIMHFS